LTPRRNFHCSDSQRVAKNNQYRKVNGQQLPAVMCRSIKQQTTNREKSMRPHHSIAEILRAFRFPVYLISGKARHGPGTLNILYAGSDPARAYLTSLAIRGPADSVFLGK
jgi:hypothetical protein